MAKAPKNAPAVAGLTLAAIVAATQTQPGFLFASKEAAASFIDDGTAEINEGVTNPSNGTEFAVRATAEGINRAMNTTNENPAPAAVSTKPTFERLQVEAPASKPRGGGGVTVYPFDELAAPSPSATPGGKPTVDAFFVPATADKPKPWESLQSAVSAATRRYAEKTGEKTIALSKPNAKTGATTQVRALYAYTRKFKLSEFDNKGVKGALVSRVQ